MSALNLRYRREARPRPKKRRFAGFVIAYCFAFLTVFTAALTVGFFITQTEPSTLITAVYGFWGAEVLGLLVKRIFDGKNRKDEES